MFNAGQRPAIDSGLSVSRVGRAAQFKATKQVAKSLKIELASFNEMKSFAQFGSDLDANTVAILKHGEVLLQVLRQEQYKPRSLNRQVFELFMAKEQYLDDLEINQVRPTLDAAYKYVSTTKANLLKSINEKKEISDEVANELKATIEDFMKMNK